MAAPASPVRAIGAAARAAPGACKRRALRPVKRSCRSRPGRRAQAARSSRIPWQASTTRSCPRRRTASRPSLTDTTLRPTFGARCASGAGWRSSTRSSPRRDNWAVGNVPPDFRLSGFHLEDGRFAPTPVEIRDQQTGQRARLTVIGVLTETVPPQMWGISTSQRTLEGLLGARAAPTVYWLDLAQGTDATMTAKALESSLLAYGLEAESLQETLDDTMAVQKTFNYLVEGFMGLGLVIGVAALGVITARAVVERRQQIGVLRSIGFRKRMIQAAFLAESSFVALTAIVVGTLLGLAISYSVIADVAAQPAWSNLSVHVPWLNLGAIFVVVYGVALLTTLAPAVRASRVSGRGAAVPVSANVRVAEGHSQPTTSGLDALPPADVARKARTVGVAKAAMPAVDLFVLAVLAGAFIGLGAVFATTVATGAGDMPYGVGRSLIGVAFSLGLILVVVAGAELFTGNNLIVMAGMTTGRHAVTPSQLGGRLRGQLRRGVCDGGALVWLAKQYTFGGGEAGVTALSIATTKTSLGFDRRSRSARSATPSSARRSGSPTARTPPRTRSSPSCRR